MSISVLVPLFMLCVLSFVGRATMGSWLAPGAFFPLFWTFLIACSISMPEYPLWDIALWWILGTLLLFSIGSYLGGIGAPSDRIQDLGPLPRHITLPRLDSIVAITSALAVLYVLLRPMVAPGVLDKPPVWIQPLLACLYASPIFGGMLFAISHSKRSKCVALIPFVPTTVYAFAYMGRSPILAGVYFWLAGFWSMRILVLHGRVPLLTRRAYFLAPLMISVLVVAGMIIGALRATDASSLSERLEQYPVILREFDLSKEWRGFRSSVFGHPYAFSYYLAYALDNPPEPQYGQLTFAGPLELVNIRERIPVESFEVDKDVMSNVFTLFRPPIDDFGLAGSFVAFFAAGLIAGWAYARISHGNPYPIPLLNMFYPHVLVIGGYFFSFNSMILAHVMVAVYLYWVPKQSWYSFGRPVPLG